MKRVGNLMPAITEMDNIRLAWLKTIRGKQFQPHVRRFGENLDANLSQIAKELIFQTFHFGCLSSFVIHDPKERTIHVAPLRDRVVQHAIMNVCEPVFERYQINGSYACRKGKGQFSALDRAISNSRRTDWYLKLDIHKYFNSISHEILKKLLFRLFKDNRLLEILNDLIDSHYIQPGRGIPIGNLTSQYFANHYLGVLDHHIKEQLGVRYYVRYMDDFVLWSNDRRKLLTYLTHIQEFLEKQLGLSLNPPCMNRTSAGMPYLGYRVRPSGLRLSHRGRYRMRRKYRKMMDCYQTGLWTENELARHLEPLFEHAKHASSQAFRLRVLNEG